MDKRFPIHLCQPDERKACAACCGIYNFTENDRAAVTRRLLRNSQALGLHSVPEVAVLEDHARRWREWNNGRCKRFATVFNCEFVGFIDRNQRRVGCLLHPTRYHGGDFRYLSFYG